MAITKTSAKKKLTVAKRLGCIMINVVTVRENKNGNKYIPTPFGAVYAQITEVKPGLCMVVELSNGALALNTPTTDDTLGFVNEKMESFPNLSARDIMDMYSL